MDVIKLPDIPIIDDTEYPISIINKNNKSKSFLVDNNNLIENESINEINENEYREDENKNINKISSQKTLKDNDTISNKEIISAEILNDNNENNIKSIDNKNNDTNIEVNENITNINISKKNNTHDHKSMNWKTMKKEIQNEIVIKLKENKNQKRQKKNKNDDKSFIDLSGNTYEGNLDSSIKNSLISSTMLNNRNTNKQTKNNNIKEIIRRKKDKENCEDIVNSSSVSFNISEDSVNTEITYSSSNTSTGESESAFEEKSEDSLSYFFYNPNLKVKRVISNPMVRSYINSRNTKKVKESLKISNNNQSKHDINGMLLFIFFYK